MGNYERIRQETKERIQQAFWELYKTKPIEKITVKNVTDITGIYRTTFYLHFADVYAIREKIEAELMEELRGIKPIADETEAENSRYMQDMHEMFKRNYDYLHILLDEKHHPEFAASYKTELVGSICEMHHIERNHMDEKTDMVIRKTISMLVDMFFYWAGSALFTFEEMVSIVKGYMNRGILETLYEGVEK